MAFASSCMHSTLEVQPLVISFKQWHCPFSMIILNFVCKNGCSVCNPLEKQMEHNQVEL